MASFAGRPQDAFGPDSPCRLDNCPIEWSLFGYRPSLAANVTFLVIFALIGIAHSYLGFRWRSWGFMTGMLLGCVSEILGYVGRILLWQNPFSYYGFLIQIICLTIAPVFFTASIYVTLSKTIIYFDASLSRFKPQLFYWIFIPFDVVCLALQAAGGALSTSERNGSRTGVNISQAGLSLQVVVLVVFMVAFADYMIRLVRSGRGGHELTSRRSIAFFSGLVAAALLILTRCAFRVAELKDGYGGKLFREEVPFIVLEGVMVVLAGIALMLGNPGIFFDKPSVRNAGHPVSSKHGHSDSDEVGMTLGEYNGAKFTNVEPNGTNAV